MESQLPPSCVVARAVMKLDVATGMSRDEPGAAYVSTGPMRTITGMVCGASTAFGSVTVTMPLETPCGRPVVLIVNWMVWQVLAAVVVVQFREAPSVAITQGTEEVREGARAPSPAL